MLTRENYASEENKSTLFVVILLQVKTLIAIVYRPQEKKYANNLKHALDFYYCSQFYMATFQTATHGMHAHLMHIYLFSVSINRMLILQLKIFLSVHLCFHFDFLCNIAFISHKSNITDDESRSKKHR